jgi:hypothetical protein
MWSSLAKVTKGPLIKDPPDLPKFLEPKAQVQLRTHETGDLGPQQAALRKSKDEATIYVWELVFYIFSVRFPICIYILTKRNIEKERERESERERERKRERENKNQKHKIVQAPFQQLRIFNVYIYILLT